jgi:hypothetical protein
MSPGPPARSNVALTLRFADICTWQVPVPLHEPPPHDTSSQSNAGAADSVTPPPDANEAVQVPDAALAVTTQVMPAGDDVIVPDPVALTVS